MPDSANSDYPIEIDAQSVKQLLDAREDFEFIDCREEEEYNRCNIAGAKLLPMSQLLDRAGELESAMTKRVVVHCHHGGRSLRVASWLRERGFAHAQSMKGGIDDWSVNIDQSVPRY